LPRLLNSVKELNAPLFVLDSGSTDSTIAIAQQAGATVKVHAFENHPQQWDFALKNFAIQTPWVICLDADQTVTPELKQRLFNFTDDAHRDINAIYFNRKNFFKGRWIKHGGYYPFYLLKMFRYGIGYSDLNENMDHRFIVPGKSELWKEGHLLEENLKENDISFWITKHNRYSDLVAQEEVERMQQLRTQTIKPRLTGSPDERTAWLKSIWWQMPLFLRPFIYLFYRLVIRLGVLDGRTGIIFHFLQGFWFRLVVDIKISELLSQKAQKQQVTNTASPLKFALVFGVLFLVFYYFHIFFLGITSPGNYYSPFLAGHLNYIQGLRNLLLSSTAGILKILGYMPIYNDYELLVPGRGIILLAHDCLGLGVISFFAAFVLAYPKKWRAKLVFLIGGIIGIQVLNVIRLVLMALYWKNQHIKIIDHHTLFNTILYIIIAITLYFWVKHNDSTHAKNKPVGL
jgi:exosortase/archaeosortase family protein